MFYLVKSSWFIKQWYKNCTWQMNAAEKNIYLTFDDGPHPAITTFVLDELKKYNAGASFFCIGKNVVAYPEVYRRIIEEGHTVGNHTQQHLNGWKTKDDVYLDDIAEAKKYIDSNLYRPPYGRISRFQLSQLGLPRFQLHTVMWSVLSGDFDTAITKERCLANVINNTGNGSIVVFHDSEKAFERMQYALPATLEYFSKKGYVFKKIVINS
ncbi:MAG: polysaccharide deacetylase family protein [Bacteroidetes bacterium]|nr:polysaccharide deacetylase family protein [Bacteroidota bacterium]